MRLRVPERHAQFLKVGDPVRLDGNEVGEEGPTFGTVTLIYPQIEEGRVLADATVKGLGDYFVGQRIRVWISAGDRWTLCRSRALRRNPIRPGLRAPPPS